MFNIKLLNKISPAGLDNFDSSKYAYGEDIQNPDAVMVRSAKMHDMQFDDSLLAIARAGAGTNNIPCDKCAENGVVVFNTPGANANAVKELVLLGLLISSRKVPAALDWVKGLKGNGDEVTKMVEKGKSQFVGPEIQGKTLGIIGLGAIGILVANAAISLGMKVYGYDPFLSVDSAWRLSKHAVHAKELSEIYANCDYITIHVPCNSETKGMINSESLALMKDGVRILNFARGELVNTADIIAAAADGKVSAYVTDFPNDDLIGAQNVICIPHLGASTPESEDNCAFMAANELIEYLENGNIINSVNLPNASMPRSTGKRICVIHKNISSMVSTITTAIADKGENIENMLNQSRGEYAYTILDVSESVSDDIVGKLSSVDGIIRVRII